MRQHKTGLRFGTAAVACVVMLVAAADAAVVTTRLGTGLPPSPTTGRLPEAWVAPAKTAPVVDGKLDEAAWSATRPVVLGKLTSSGEISPRTEVRLVHKDRVLYVGVKAAEPNVAAIKRTVSDADGPAYGDDSVELFLSPFPDRGYYQVIVSAAGGIFDRHGHGDPSHWDSGTRAAVQIGRKQWSLEAAVPMRALGPDDDMPKRWRANVYRNRRAGGREESQAFSPTFRPDYDVPERFGYLLFTPESPWAEVEGVVSKQSGIEVKEPGDGTTVLLFDLSSIPKGAEVYRARLRCEREPMDGLNDDVLEPIEIYPLSGPYRQGAPPQTSDKPLELVRPWYDGFEMTGLVGGWVGKRTQAGVWVKTFPDWRKDRTFLDVTFEGQPGDVPPAARDLKAFHRAGQTFLSWKEIDDPVGRDEIPWREMKSILGNLDRQRQIRYCIYRWTGPITPETLSRADRIAEVKPLSGWNLNGRNIGRPIDRFIATARVLDWHQWNPFRDASLDGDYGRDCPIDRFVIRDGERPLERGTGLYVHTATKGERAYYAVVTMIDGVANTRDLRGGLNVTGPVDEAVAEPQPVLQGELPRMPLFRYDQRRLHYVRWVAEPLTNRPYDYHNWSVGVPKGVKDGAALELNLHRDGYSYWRTHYRIEPGSIVLCPYDFPLSTWWFGYHECYGTLRPWSDGPVRNYTERRLMSFVEWAAKKWPVDRNRILVTGCQGGASGSGALHLGLRYPDVFNLTIAGHGEPNYQSGGEPLERIWGKTAWNLKTESGRGVWELLDLVRMVRSLPPGTELPFVSMTYSDRQQQTHALAEALMAAGHAAVTHTAWGGQRMVPVSANATGWCLPLDIRKDRAMLAVFAAGKTGDAVRNGSLLWQTADMEDRPERFAVTLRQGRGPFAGTITLRRLQRFEPQPGGRYAWRLQALEIPGNVRDKPEPIEGTVAVGRDGLMRIPEVTFPEGTHRLTITPSR